MLKIEQKEMLCDKHRKLLITMNMFNGIVLQAQLIQILLELNLYKNKTAVHRAFKELQDQDVLKEYKPNFLAYKNVFLVFKKYAVRYLTNSWTTSQDVPSVKIPLDNSFYIQKMAKTQYFIDYVISFYKETQFTQFQRFLNNTYNSFDSNTLDYAYNLKKLKYINIKEIDKDIHNLNLIKENLFKKRTLLPDHFYDASLSDVLGAKTYINKLAFANNIVSLDLFYLDFTDNLDLKKLEKYYYETCVACLSRLIDKKYSVKINFNIAFINQGSLDAFAKKNLTIPNFTLVNLNIDKFYK